MPVRFGAFEVDPAASQLRKNGRRVRLQEQPFQILCALLERPGDLVTRDELKARLWPAQVHLDHERGLNKAVLKVRGALGDSAERPFFIETVPKHGYRFIAPVDRSGEPAASGPPAIAKPPGRVAPPWLRIAVLGSCALAAAALAWRLIPSSRPSPLVRFTVRLPPGLGFVVYNSASIAFSHDGERVAYAARGREGGGVYLRALEGLEVTRLPGTERARSPFFSPDDTWIGFEAGEKLKRAAVTGGAPQILVDLPFPAGATATEPDGSIVLVPSFTGGLFRVGRDGGRPVRLTTPDVGRDEGAHIWPASLPEGRGILFTVWSGGARSFDQAKVAVLPRGGPEPRVLLEGGYGARYVPSGHLVLVRGGALHAAPFDLSRLQVTGPTVPVVPGVLSDASTGAALYDVSAAGHLAYVPGTLHRQLRRLVLVDRKGMAQPVGQTSGPYVSPRLSPDGTRIALWIEEAQAEVWTLDLSSDAFTRLTFGGDSHSPCWSPDGTRLAYESGRNVVHQIYLRPADGGGSERNATAGEYHHYLSDWSGDGRLLAFTEFDPETGADVWVTGVAGTARPRPIANTASSEKEATFSPDGRWIAYVSDEAGPFEVFAQPFPGPGRRVRVSTGGGEEPAWSRDGREIYFRRGRQLLAASVGASPDLEIGKPAVLFEGSYLDNIAPTRSYDVTPDGRFLMVTEPVGDDLPQELTVVLGWAEELKRRVPRR